MSVGSMMYEEGARIHRMVMNEGGYMVHSGGKSWFEKFDRESGELSRKFSPGLMETIRASVNVLRYYAAERRAEFDRLPTPGLGSPQASPSPIGTPAVTCGN